jgi:hypothetical protein
VRDKQTRAGSPDFSEPVVAEPEAVESQQL